MFDRERGLMPGELSSDRRIVPWLLKALLLGVSVVLAFQIGKAAHDSAPLVVLIVVAAPALLLLVTSNLERAVFIFLVYAAFEGLLKNIAANNPLAFMLRDVLLLAILGKLVFGEGKGDAEDSRRPDGFSTSFVVTPILLFIVVSVVQMLNTSYDDLGSNVVIGLGGIHMRIIPMVLFFAALRFVRRREQVERFHRLIIYLGLAVAMVLVIQIAIGPSRWASLGFSFYSQGAGNVYSPTGENYGVSRVSSTAQDAGAAAWFILTAIFISLSVLSRRRTAADHSMIVDLASVGFLVLALALTYTRTAYMAFALGAGAFLLLRREQFGGRLPVIAAGVLLMVSIAASVVPDSYLDAVFYRAQMSVMNPVQAYTSQQGGRFNLLMDIPNYIQQHPVGVGLGRTGPGQATFSRWFPDAHFFLVENGFGAVIFELSVVAGLLVAWIYFAILSRGLRITMRLRDDGLKASASSMLVCVFVTLAAMFSMNPLDASPFNGYLWFLSGMLMALPQVEENEAQLLTAPGRVGRQP